MMDGWSARIGLCQTLNSDTFTDIDMLCFDLPTVHLDEVPEEENLFLTMAQLKDRTGMMTSPTT